METCEWVDDEIVELHALGRIEDEFVREHLDHCASCIARVVELQLWIELLKRGLLRLRETSEQRQQASDDNSNRQDGS